MPKHDKAVVGIQPAANSPEITHIALAHGKDALSIREAIATGADSLLAVNDAAKLLCVSKATVYKWINQGELSDLRSGEKRVVLKSEVLKQLQVA
ncbi:MAG TPA: helix-turn-helix domain-containing protein [Granulicella sp.]